MRNTSRVHCPCTVLCITEGSNTEYLLTKWYTDPLFIARRCSIAIADGDVKKMASAAFPEAVAVKSSIEELTNCYVAVDFDREIFSVKECGQWFELPMRNAIAAADWCYERLENIPPEKRVPTFYLRAMAVCHGVNNNC